MLKRVFLPLVSIFLLCCTVNSYADDLIVYVNTLDQKRSNIDAMSYYSSNKNLIESAYASSNDQSTRQRFLFEMAMRCKSLSEQSSFEQNTKEIYRTKAKEFLKRYIEWYNNLDEAQLMSLPANDTISQSLEIRFGRIQTVTQFLTTMLVDNKEYDELNELITGIPSILYLNSISFNNWKLAIRKIYPDAGQDDNCFEPFWTRYREWAKEFPLRPTHRDRYLEEAEIALVSIRSNN